MLKTTTKKKKRTMSEQNIARPPYSKKVNDWLEVNSGYTLLEYCKMLKYYPATIKIMELDDDNKKQIQAALKSDAELKDIYLSFDRESSARTRKGNRTWTRFFQDIITGWVMEDLTIEMLRRQGIEIDHTGKDSQRRIYIGKTVSQASDCIVKVGDVKRRLELTNEFNSLMVQDGYIEKRAPALSNLWKAKAIWLYRELESGKYVLIDFATEKVITHFRHHQRWGKDVQRYILAENGKRIRDDRLLAAELISVAGCGIEGVEQPKMEVLMDEGSPPHNPELIGGIPPRKTSQENKPKEEEPTQTPKKETEKIEPPQQQERSRPTPRKEVKQMVQEAPDIIDDGSMAGADGTDWAAVAAANAEVLDF